MSFRFADRAQYLGCCLSFPLNQDAEIAQRIQYGWNAFKKFEDVLCSRTVPLLHKKRALDACVKPAVLYGAKTWALRGSDIKKLAVTQRKMERRMLGLTVVDRWNIGRIRALTKLKDWTKEAMRMKLLRAERIRGLK